jgi:alanine dehydrogenase
VVERGAGIGSGFADEEYVRAGSTLVDDHAAVFEQAELIVKVKEPQPAEVSLLRPSQILFTYLHLAADKTLTESLAKSSVTGIAYETIEVNRRLPLLEPMSEIAGRMSVLVGGFSGETLRRQRHVARRRAGRAGGQGRGARRRLGGHQRRTHGHRPWRGRDDSGSGH